jgi:hypothetical protein
MGSKSKMSAIAVVLVGLAVSQAFAASSTYKIAVEIMGPDGSRRAAETFQCATQDRCQNAISLIVNGKPFKIGVRSYLLDDRHIRVMLQGKDLVGGPFSDTESDRPFEAGQEWDEQLVKWVWGSKTPKVYGKAHIRIEN